MLQSDCVLCQAIKQSRSLMEAKIILHIRKKNLCRAVYRRKANEIMLPQNYIDFLGKSYHPGDTITFDVTGTGHESRIHAFRHFERIRQQE